MVQSKGHCVHVCVRERCCVFQFPDSVAKSLLHFFADHADLHVIVCMHDREEHVDVLHRQRSRFVGVHLAAADRLTKRPAAKKRRR